MQDNKANWISLIALLIIVASVPLYGVMESQRMEHAKVDLREAYVAQGIDLYVQNCASCHGTDGTGIGMMPALNRDGMNEIEDEALHKIIARESHGSIMAAWHIDSGGLMTDYQITNVATLVKHADWNEVARVAAVRGFVEPDEPAVENGMTYMQIENSDDPHQCNACHEEDQPAAHTEIFGLNCARCHNTVSWTPAMLTRHDFMLDHGDMGEVDCKTCHPVSYTTYDCYGCHEDHQAPEMEEFHVKENIFEYADCARCHPTGVEGEADRLRKENPNLNGSLPVDPDQSAGLLSQPRDIDFELVQSLADDANR